MLQREETGGSAQQHVNRATIDDHGVLDSRNRFSERNDAAEEGRYSGCDPTIRRRG